MLISADLIFDNIYYFLRFVIAAWKKGREVIFVDCCCSPLENKVSLVAVAKGEQLR